MVSSGSDSDDSDIIRTTFDTSAPSSTRSESVSHILAESDRVLKELKACTQTSFPKLLSIQGCVSYIYYRLLYMYL